MRARTLLLATVIIWTSPLTSPPNTWGQTMPCSADQGRPGHGPFRRVPRDEPDEGSSDAAQKPQQPGRAALSRESYLQLDKDSTELLRLATELTRMVAQSNQQTLSVEIG